MSMQNIPISNNLNLRIIPKIEIKNNNLVKGVNFEGLRSLGSPSDFIKKYYSEGADEIIIIDVVASGGISASYAAVGDFLIFEGEKSKFMFAGPRVIRGTISEGELPISFQEGTFCVSHGFGDFIIKNRKDTKNTLVKLLNILLKIDTSVNSVSSDETSELNNQTREVS